MKSAASFFSLSLPLIKENLRRYWAIPVISFLVYFLAGILPILSAYSDLSYMSNFISSLLDNYNGAFMAVHLILPIVTGVVVFRYLQTPAFTTSLHGMPFTRAKLFNSTALSGLILSTFPAILTGIILLLISKPVSSRYYYSGVAEALDVNVFARADILSWLGGTLVIIITLYAVTVFAGLLTGNSIIHLLAGLGFNFLPVALFSLFTAYCNQFLYGFAVSENWYATMMKLSPYLNSLGPESAHPWSTQLLYILVAIALLALSMLLYYKRALERATDAFVFAFMTPVATFLVALFGMSLIGFYFQLIGRSYSYLYPGFLIGAVIFFLIGRMIVKITFRVFNRETARSLGVFTVVAAVFVLSFTLDLTGFEKRLPSENGIDGVTTSFLQRPEFFITSLMGDDSPTVLTSAANIHNIREFHKSILENRQEADSLQDSRYTHNTWGMISYRLNGPFDMHRQYAISYGQLRDDAHLAQIFESSEYKSQLAFSDTDLTDVTALEIYNLGRTATITGRSNIVEILARLDEDYQAQKYGEAVNMRRPYASLSLVYRSSDRPQAYFRIDIPMSYNNTITWLRENGYGEIIEINPDMIASVSVYKQGLSRPVRTEYYEVSTEVSTEVGQEITDKEQIATILDAAEIGIYTREYYEVEVRFLPEITAEYEDRSNYYYFSDETAPDFIRELF